MDLDPEVHVVCLRHMALCSAEGIELLITSTYRDIEEQDAIYAQGRSTPGKIVTYAKGGQSWHNFKAAYDCVPLVRGKADWNIRDDAFRRMVELGKQAGAEAGYDWPGKKQDADHFQVRPTVEGLHINLDEAMDRFQRNGSIFLV